MIKCPKCGFEPDHCEHCGPVLEAFEYGGTSWCKECLESVKAEEQYTEDDEKETL